LLQARFKVKLFSYQFFEAIISGNTKLISDFLVQGLFRGVYKFDWLIFRDSGRVWSPGASIFLDSAFVF